jgi:single-strand DNA-binding protein
MADLNLWLGTGRLGRDPEVRHLANGEAVVNISIACSRQWKDKDSGEKKEQTTWVRVSFFGKTAELVGKYCKKGSQIRVTGELTVRKYKDKDDQEREVTEVRGTELQLLGGKPEGGGAPAPAPRPAPKQQDNFDDAPFN